MKKQCKPISFIIMNVLLVFNFLVYWSIRSMWSGIIAIAGKPAPYILCAVLVITALCITTLTLYKKHPLPAMIWGCVIDVIFLGLCGYMLSVTMDSWHYFILEFIYGLFFMGGIALFIFLCFYSHKIPWFQKKWLQPVCILLLLVIGLFTILVYEAVVKF